MVVLGTHEYEVLKGVRCTGVVEDFGSEAEVAYDLGTFAVGDNDVHAAAF